MERWMKEDETQRQELALLETQLEYDGSQLEK